MSREERSTLMESIAEKFVALDESGKAFIAGYMAGKQEARKDQEQNQRVLELAGR